MLKIIIIKWIKDLDLKYCNRYRIWKRCPPCGLLQCWERRQTGRPGLWGRPCALDGTERWGGKRHIKLNWKANHFLLTHPASCLNLNRGFVLCMMPSLVWSLALVKRTSQSSGSEAGSTAKPWFWLVMKQRSVPLCMHGWLWPRFPYLNKWGKTSAAGTHRPGWDFQHLRPQYIFNEFVHSRDVKEHIIQIQCDDLFDPPEMTPSNVQSSRAGETVSDYCDLHTEPDKIPNESQGKRPPPQMWLWREQPCLSCLFSLFHNRDRLHCTTLLIQEIPDSWDQQSSGVHTSALPKLLLAWMFILHNSSRASLTGVTEGIVQPHSQNPYANLTFPIWRSDFLIFYTIKFQLGVIKELNQEWSS